jgi:hypothetical protein
MNKFDMPTQLDAINFHNTHDTLSVPKGMTLKQLVEDYDRLNNIIDETKEKLKFALKCKDNELQCVFEAYEIEEMINKLELKEGK